MRSFVQESLKKRIKQILISSLDLRKKACKRKILQELQWLMRFQLARLNEQ